VTDRELDLVRQLGEELRATFAEERRAISKLDHQRLEFVAEQKLRIVAQLEQLRTAAPSHAPEVRALFEALRAEARATAMLGNAATELVRALLGQDTNAVGYDRRANKTAPSTGPLRIIAAY
jgi:flagellar biosynthesis/type III secretory pathway chaperone